MADLTTVKIRDLIETQSVATTDYMVLEKDTGTFKCQARFLKGATGLTPNITVGNTTTLSPGQLATVTKRGNIENPIFDFGIPQGIQGQIGPQGPKGDTPDITPLQTQIDDRFNALTSQQQGDSEVIDARGGYPSLKARFDNLSDDLSKINDQTLITYTTESNFNSISNTKNGYLDEILLQGKTLVNMFNPSQNKNFILNGTQQTFKILNNINLQPNTDYTLIFNCETYNTNGDGVRLSNYFLSGGTDPTICNKAGMVNFKFNTGNNPREVDGVTIYVGTSNSTGNIKLKEFVLIKGNYESGYFEGIKSVGENVSDIYLNSFNENKNFNALYDEKIDGSYYFYQNGNKFDVSNMSSLNYKNNKYKFIEIKAYFLTHLTFFNNDTFISGNLIQNNTNLTIKVPYNCTEIRVGCRKDLKQNDIYLIQDNKKVLYKDTDSNWKKPILRQWDSIEKHSDGKYYYHKRSEQIIYNGSENWSIEIKNNIVRGTVVLDCFYNVAPICDKLKGEVFNDSDYEYAGIGGSDNLFLGISKTKLSTVDEQGFKEWLRNNNVNVVYKLKKEQVFECTPIDLISYETQTNYSVECGPIYPKTTLKVNSYLGNVVSILKDKVSYLENVLVDGLKLVVAGNMQELAYRLYPQDFVSNVDNEVIE